MPRWRRATAPFTACSGTGWSWSTAPPTAPFRGAQARAIDFDEPDANTWSAINQFTVTESGNTRRPDIVVFVNDLPLTVIELKNPADENATVWSAFHQLQTYKVELPSLFAGNAVLAVSDGMQARIGTLSAGREWFKPWRTSTVRSWRRPSTRSCRC